MTPSIAPDRARWYAATSTSIARSTSRFVNCDRSSPGSAISSSDPGARQELVDQLVRDPLTTAAFLEGITPGRLTRPQRWFANSNANTKSGRRVDG
jgi:hypothetical protein